MKEVRRTRVILAFTLLELLVAVAIASVLVSLLLAVSTTASNLWTRANGRISTAAAARAVLDQVEADLHGAIFREDGAVWFAVTVLTATSNSGSWITSTATRPASESLVLTEGAIEDDRFGVAGCWLRMFTDNGGQSAANPSAVAYQLVRRRPTTASAGEISYILFRSVVTDANTLSAGYNLDPNLTMPSPSYVIANGTEGQPGNVIRPPLVAAIADHVVDFGVRFFRYNNSTLQPLFPATSAGTWTNAELGHLVRLGSNGTSETARPDVIEVMVRILTDEGVRQLRNYENPPIGYTRTGTWWDIVTRHSHVYTRRIVLTQGST